MNICSFSTGTAGCGYYKFEMDKDKVNREEIVRAELRLYQNNTPVGSPSHYHVHVYYLLRAKDLESPLQISFKHVAATPGWKTFDITPIAASWKQQGWVNHGLQVRLTKGDEHLPCDGVFSNGKEGTIDTEPSLVVYTHDHDSKFFEGLLKKEEKSISRVTQQRRRKHSREVTISNVGCHRKQLIVTRESVSSGSIHLLLPFQFDAGVCVGHCRRTEQNEPKPMSYASIVSLHYLHTVGINNAPSRCCVPIHYDNIPMMLFVDPVTNQRILKTNVPVKVKKHGGCGCL